MAACGVSKRFGALVANEAVDFDVRAGEVHALIGENGAGKSTLMSLLYGLMHPDSGTIAVDGRAVRFSSCVDAMKAGIGMVFQHFLLVERFSVAQNVMLGREPGRRGMLDRRSSEKEVARLATGYGFALNPATPVEDLGVGARQQVELLKVLERNARVLILDEPTAALSPQEASALFDIVHRLRSEGRAVILIAHKLKEVLSVADRITVLRRGKVVGSVEPEQADEAQLGLMMVGRSIDLDKRVPRIGAPADVALRITSLDVPASSGAGLHGFSLQARAGEIVGIAGVEGNGQIELAEALYGLREPTAGAIALEGRDITSMSCANRRRLGVRYVPPDRQREGLVLDFSTEENALLGDQRRLRRGSVIPAKTMRRRADAIAREYALAGYSPSVKARDYSGGNQQRLIVGRELSEGAALLLVCAPTRGLDVGAAAVIRERLRAARDAGACILLVSYDLDELRALADRIIVLCGGVATGELTPENADDATLGMLMGGIAA
ncbi:MAG: ABC transporter ATP-binding protein [Candidatus Eremiobacteraeota bacterium]|nr:ABC transporter ATP-binding protein [Candidatus Eremiobacteraeota bacterium]MBC5826551.1 ABC transporter ATP-binding protein [Candidatus Eremiobacteraeota bacterium]